MFDNTLLLNGTSVAVDLSIIDTDNGTTTRSKSQGGGNRTDFTIARTESNENKGIVSDRILVRCDQIITELVAPYTPVKISVYHVFVVPRRPDVTPVIVRNVADMALNFLRNAEEPISTVSPGVLDRLLAGET